MEKQTSPPPPPPPLKKDVATRKAKRAILPSLIWGEWGLDFFFFNYSPQDGNLGQNEMEQQTSIPPKIKDQAKRKPKRAIFPFLIWGSEV